MVPLVFDAYNELGVQKLKDEENSYSGVVADLVMFEVLFADARPDLCP